MNKSIKKKFNNIKVLAMDFDGVMTDGCVYVNQNGQETVKCSRKDGLGIAMLKRSKIEVLVISKEVNPVVTARCQKLKIKCWQKIKNSSSKFKILNKAATKMKIGLSEVAYIGDDLNDLDVFGRVGLSITVADGHNKLKERADYITGAKGGEHAVREVCELILSSKGIDLSF